MAVRNLSENDDSNRRAISDARGFPHQVERDARRAFSERNPRSERECPCRYPCRRVLLASDHQQNGLALSSRVILMMNKQIKSTTGICPLFWWCLLLVVSSHCATCSTFKKQLNDEPSRRHVRSLICGPAMPLNNIEKTPPPTTTTTTTIDEVEERGGERSRKTTHHQPPPQHRGWERGN